MGTPSGVQPWSWQYSWSIRFRFGSTLFALAIADAVAGGIGLDNRCTFRMVQEYVDDTILVSEEEIAGAMAFALEEHHLVVEEAGAVGIAALLYGRVKEIGRKVVVVISGSDVDLPLLLEIAQGDGG